MRPLNVILLFALALLPADTGASKNGGDVWQSREELVNRFAAEWQTYNLLERELGGIADALGDLSDIELFPTTLTGFDKTALVRFDKQLENLGRERQELRGSLDALKAPLVDALAILHEMVVRQPVSRMFDLLDQGNLTRRAEQQGIAQRVDTLWKGIDQLLSFVQKSSGVTVRLPLPAPDSRTCGRIMDALKDSLAGRANLPYVKEMFSIENHRIKQLIKENAVQRAQRKIPAMIARYKGKTDLLDLPLSAARISLLLGDYAFALAALSDLPDDGNQPRLRQYYRMQCRYALHRYDSVWQESERLDYSHYGGASRNFLLWIAMESGLALKKKNAFVRLASFVDRKAPYALNVMHALGRSYLAEKDPSTALSVFESAARFPRHAAADETAGRELLHAIAETNYELGRYDKALRLFYELANNRDDFERGLYGVLWCYLQLGQNEKAETTMRTLINQAPESRFAADAFVILAYRYLNRARDEWKRTRYLTNEEQRLKELVSRIESKKQADTVHERSALFDKARNDLLGLLSRIRENPYKPYDSLVKRFDRVLRICNLVSAHYTTGTFQNAAFTEKRELLLYLLDSLMLAAKKAPALENGSFAASPERTAAAAIKSVVFNASIFMTEAMIEFYRFELEYVNWQKSRINSQEQEALRHPLLQKTDSASLAAVAALRKHYGRRLDSLLAIEDTIHAVWNDRLTPQLQSVLNGPIDDANAAYFHYHLGELYYTDENARYTKEYESFEKLKTAYEQKMAAFREGTLVELPVEPKPPRIDHARSMAEYTRAIAQAPASEVAASSHYSLSWCWNDLGIFDSALAHMDTVTTKFPQSPFVPQAWMYAGEYMFDKGNLARAIQCYQSVMKYPESEWFDEALYKLAWSQYRLSNPGKAIGSFLALVELGGGKKNAKALLEKESLDYVAISFSESDMTGEKGLERALIFAKKLGNSDRGSQIIHRLAKVYLDQGRYELAEKTYRTLLKVNPHYPDIPSVESEMLVATERSATPDQANRAKIDFFKKYNSKSTWAKTQSDYSMVTKADSLAEYQLYDAAIGYHQAALQKNDTAVYGRAMEVYTNFIQAYPTSKLASECHYNLAEIEFSLGLYTKATEDYIAVSKRYPDSKFRETAAWNAIVASQNLLKKEGTLR